MLPTKPPPIKLPLTKPLLTRRRWTKRLKLEVSEILSSEKFVC
jgi:hypothetical protein